MNLSLHLWREWREHRFALWALVGLLPLGTWLLSLALSRGVVGDPLFHLAVGLGFGVVFLVVVGGELLGLERRGLGLRWLERLPDGLAGAFRAKLLFFAATFAAALAFGYGVGWLCAALRHAATASDRQLSKLIPVLIVLGAWTFAASAWTLRGGLALLAAALVVAVLGLPVWRVLEAGYRPSLGEVCALAGVLTAAALLGAWLGFVPGARLGRAPALAALLGLAPAGVVLLPISGWSSHKLEERDAFDPLAADFDVMEARITADARTVFAFGQNVRRRWNRELMPIHALRVDLENGTSEDLGRLESVTDRYRVTPAGAYELDEYVVALEDREPLAFGVAHGEARAFVDRPSNDGWYRRGLGMRVSFANLRHVIRDPFRGRDFSFDVVGDVAISGLLLVRPGRWLYAPRALSWFWFDPQTKEQNPVDWPDGTKPLVLFEDGRILIRGADLGLRLIHPENGTSVTLDSQGVAPEDILPNDNGERTPSRWGRHPEVAGPVVLRTRHGFLVLDENALTVRRIDVHDDVRFGRLVDRETAIVRRLGNHGSFARLDLVSGELTTLWPR